MCQARLAYYLMPPVAKTNRVDITHRIKKLHNTSAYQRIFHNWQQWQGDSLAT